VAVDDFLTVKTDLKMEFGFLSIKFLSCIF